MIFDLKQYGIMSNLFMEKEKENQSYKKSTIDSKDIP